MILRTLHVDAKKWELENLGILILKLFEASPTSNIIVEYSFDIKKYIPRVWSTSGHCVDTTAGYFFGNCPKFRPKWPKICERYKLYDPKCCSVWVQLKKKLIQNVFIYFNIVPSHYKGYLPKRFPATGELSDVS